MAVRNVQQGTPVLALAAQGPPGFGLGEWSVGLLRWSLLPD